MSVEVRHFTATVPAGVTASSPHVVDISFPPRIVRRVDWRVPRGPMGVMGWLIAMGGVPVLPTSGFTWVVADGESGGWTVEQQPDSGGWQVLGYNAGSYPHSVYLAFHLDLVHRPARQLRLEPAAALAEAPDLSQAAAPVRRRR